MIETLALTCLAQTIFMEARGEPVAGQIAVGMVLYRRADFNSLRVCSEMRKPKQFSWYGKIAPPPQNSDELKPYLSLAKQIMTFKVKDTSKGALSFHQANLKTKPEWAINKPVKVCINNHIFY